MWRDCQLKRRGLLLVGSSHAVRCGLGHDGGGGGGVDVGHGA